MKLSYNDIISSTSEYRNSRCRQTKLYDIICPRLHKRVCDPPQSICLRIPFSDSIIYASQMSHVSWNIDRALQLRHPSMREREIQDSSASLPSDRNELLVFSAPLGSVVDCVVRPPALDDRSYLPHSTMIFVFVAME